MGYGWGFNETHGIEGRAAHGKKQIFTSSMTAHTWAAQSIPEGRNSKGSVYFKKRTIYSYGEHWPLATITDRRTPDGKQVVVVNGDRAENRSRGWSGNPTNTHLRYVRNALHGHPDFHVVDGDLNSVKEAIRDALSAFNMIARQAVLDMHDAKTELCNMRKAIKKFVPNEETWGSWEELTPAERAPYLTDTKIVELCRTMQIDPPYYDLEAMRADINSAVAEWLKGEPKRIKDRAARAKRECLTKLQKWFDQKAQGIWYNRRARIADREAWEHLSVAMQHYPAARWEKYRVLLQQRALIEEINDNFKALNPDAAEIAWSRRNGRKTTGITLNEWLSGKTGYLTRWSMDDRMTTYMRKRNGRLETTQGVEVPWLHAVRAFAFAVQCYNQNQEFTPSVEVSIGHFRLDRIDADGTLHAGCHHLQFKDMVALAAQENPASLCDLRPRYPVPAVI